MILAILLLFKGDIFDVFPDCKKEKKNTAFSRMLIKLDHETAWRFLLSLSFVRS